MKPFSQKMTDQLLRWYLNQPELERLECHVEQKKRINVIMNDARKDGITLEANGEVYYRALLDGIKFRCRLQSNRKLKTTDDLEAVTAQRIAVVKARKKEKPAPKRDRLQVGDLEPVVQRLRTEGLSWQKVSDYLAEFHEFPCGRSELHKIFKGLL